MQIKVGDKFGYLTVVEIVRKKRAASNRTDLIAKCHCCCGGEKEVTIWQLPRSKHKCRCTTKQVKTGDKFGYLTVIDVVRKKRAASNKTDLLAKCRCRCGKERELTIWKLLKSKRSGTCRCNAEDVCCGTKIGMLTVISKKGSEIVCRCDCGNTYRPVSVSSLLRLKNPSCGCTWNWRKGKNNVRWCGYKDLPNKYWYRIQAGAKFRGIPFRLTRKQIWDLFVRQDRKCIFSGEPLRFLNTKGEVDITASLDRIDSNKGYTIDNVQWVHKEVQFMKQALADDRFINWCCLIAQHRQPEHPA